MKVLMISGDKNLLKEGTDAYARLQLQKSAVEELDVVVWPQVHSLGYIFSAARKNRYNVITAQDPYFRGHLALHLRQFFGGRVNIQVHSDLAGQPFVRRLFARLQLLRADSIRVVSDRIRKQVEAVGVKGKITVLPVYIDVEKFRTIAPRTHEGKNILWVGRFEKEKDPLLAIQIFERVKEDISSAKLIMLGSGSHEKELKSRATVAFPGWGDPTEYLSSADVVLSTSPYESFGASIIEALAAGVPVVARDVGVAREAGALIAGKEKLAEAVISVLQSGVRGELKLALLSKEEWTKRWRESL